MPWTPLLKLWKSIPYQFAASPLYSLRYPANRILRRVFDKQMNISKRTKEKRECVLKNNFFSKAFLLNQEIITWKE